MDTEKRGSGSDSDDDLEYIQELDGPAAKLEEGIYLKDLVQGKGQEFVIQKPEGNSDDDDMTYFTGEHLLKHVRPELLGFDEPSDTTNEEDVSKTPFEVLSKKMVDVLEDGKLKKRILKEGLDEKVTSGAQVTIHYNGYREFEDEPFDSTYMRRIPKRLRLGRGEVILGMEHAILTMKKKETSQFLIHPNLAFGSRGCPPRIPPSATLLFEITVEDFMDSLVAEAYDNMSELEKQQVNFQHTMKCAKAFHSAGVDLFKQKMFGAATKKFQRSLRMLVNVANINSQTEEIDYQKLILKLHVNLGVCYNHKEDYKKACTHCRQALEMDRKNAKAHFQYGKALFHLSDFKEADRHLKAAQKIEPHNEEINAMLGKLEERCSKAKKAETDIAYKMMKDLRITTPLEQKRKNMSEAEHKFVINVRNKLDKFQFSPSKRIDFPPAMDPSEQNLFKKEAEKRGLRFVIVRGNDGAPDHICIMKPINPSTSTSNH